MSAVEAAREAVAVALHGDTYEGVDPAARQEIDTAVGAAFTAAEPIMRAAIVEEVVKATVDEFDRYNSHTLGWRPSRSDVVTDVRARLATRSES